MGEDEYSVLPFKNLGLAGRATYGYKDRYFAEFNFGYNGSENFAPGKRFGFFPAVALGWCISEEPLWENIRPYVSKLKICGSYGTVGNDKLGDNVRFAYITEIIDDGMCDFGLPGRATRFTVSPKANSGRRVSPGRPRSNTISVWRSACSTCWS